LELGFLLVLLIEDLLLRVTEINQGRVEFLRWDRAVLLYLVVSESRILIEEEQDDSLVAVSHKGIVLSAHKYRLDFNLTMLIQPCKISVLMLVLVELFEL
jgi:hypothetical protein